MRAVAARNPDILVVGVDANADALRATSRRCAAKPSRGGLPNVLLARLPLAEAPGELVGLADALTVLLPWGSLLAAVARPEPSALCALRALCRGHAEIRIVLGYGPATEGAMIRELRLPALDVPAAVAELEGAYLAAGLAVRARAARVDEVRALPTTWAKRLAYSGHERRYVELRGRVVA